MYCLPAFLQEAATPLLLSTTSRPRPHRCRTGLYNLGCLFLFEQTSSFLLIFHQQLHLLNSSQVQCKETKPAEAAAAVGETVAMIIAGRRVSLLDLVVIGSTPKREDSSSGALLLSGVQWNADLFTYIRSNTNARISSETNFVRFKRRRLLTYLNAELRRHSKYL